MSSYPPDPGGVFASDHHRRVAAHLPLPGEDPISLEDLLARLKEDPYNTVAEIEVPGILDDLVEDGGVKFLAGAEGWRLLQAGLDKLSGPALTAIEMVDGEPVACEPPPLTGAKLIEAEAQQERIAEEGDELEKAALAAAVETLKEELAAAEEAAEKAGVS